MRHRLARHEQNDQPGGEMLPEEDDKDGYADPGQGPDRDAAHRSPVTQRDARVGRVIEGEPMRPGR